MRKDFGQMRRDFDRTRTEIVDLVEASRTKILSEIDYFKGQIIGAVMGAVESSKEVQASYVKNAFEIVSEFFMAVKNIMEAHAILFFFFFQVILLFGVIFYHKLRRQLRLFLV
jgi:hypothetical protein